MTGEVKQTVPDLPVVVQVVAFLPCAGHGTGEGKGIKTTGEIRLFRLE